MADEITHEQLAAGTEIASAGVEAAANEPDPAKRKAAASQAIRAKADEHKTPMTQEEADMIADALCDRFEQRGVFAPPPEPVASPAGAGETETTVAVAAAQTPPEPPRRQSWAERFRSSR
jgi:hypothetical protein